MVLGLRSKAKKSATVQVDYTIHFLEIKPWPPSNSLLSLRSVFLQWENGDRNTGTTPPATPSEGRIEFNESFKLRTALSKEASSKGNAIPFHKNVLELSLYESRRDKTVKGQLLGSASVNLAEHGILKGPVAVGVPVSCKRSFRNAAHPVLYLRIQPDDKEEGSTSSSVGRLSKEASMDRDVNESVSALMIGEYAEADIAPFTDEDEDGSSHSSLNHSSSTLGGAVCSSIQSSPGKQADDENVPRDVSKSGGLANVVSSESSPAKQEPEPIAEAITPMDAAEVPQVESFPELTTPELSINLKSLYNGVPSVSSTPERSSEPVLQDTESHGIHSTSVKWEAVEVESSVSKIDGSVEKDILLPEIQQITADERVEKDVAQNHANKKNGTSEIIDRVESSDNDLRKEKLDFVSTEYTDVLEPEVNEDENPQDDRNVSDEVAISRVALDMVEGNFEQKKVEKGSGERAGKEIETECLTDNADNHSIEPVAIVAHDPVINKHYLQSLSTRKTLPYDTTTFSQGILCEVGNGMLKSDGAKSMKSVRSTPDSRGIKYTTNDQCIEDVKEIDVQDDSHNAGMSSITEASNAESMILNYDKVKHISRNNRSSISNSKLRELELKVEMLEGELTVAAAIEVGLYCVVAEHGSSAHKVHTPARRLSRLYIHASKQWSQERKAAATKSAVSGLFLAAKACGNDVPRLTFWLSNSIVLRAVITQSIGQSDLHASADRCPASNGSEVMPRKKTPLKWESPRKKDKFSFTEDIDDWEDPYTFMTALERIEAWIFSRIIESIWWQTLTLHMQMISKPNESKVSSHSKKSYGKTPSLSNQQQANSSIDIWKSAFSDAFERLCPVRAGGHECGCLPMLARLIMEQCVARLDVAMFNAILRESDDDIPTDPLSDPISDSKVLPIPSGRLSFGAGAQLKNAIGNWSRWLTDLFGMDVDDIARDENEQEDKDPYVAASFNSFRLLYALSDLLMLPKNMLLERTIRKEVCPIFGALIIKRVLNSFLPDEFCPDPIPDAVLEALDSEDPRERSQESISNFPCDASPIIYSSPSIASILSFIGDVRSASMLRRNGSSVVRKCHTSDDELDELDSPLASVIIEKSTTMAKPKTHGGGSVVRYQLLREVWRHDD